MSTKPHLSVLDRLELLEDGQEQNNVKNNEQDNRLNRLEALVQKLLEKD